MTAKKKFVIDWRVEGTVEVTARSAEEAQELFDKMWETRGHRLVAEGEVSNDKPTLTGGEVG